MDEQLDKHPDGIMMRLRVSMRKFDILQASVANIEIAQSFEQPNTCYLNRLECLSYTSTSYLHVSLGLL